MSDRRKGFHRRTILLSLSAVVVVAVLWISSAIVLPFVLALVIAYVLTPSVLWLEKKGIPRWIGIVSIYLVMLGSAYGFFAMSWPRIVAEGKALAQDVPKRVQAFERDVWPQWKAKLNSLGGAEPTPAKDSPPTPGASDTTTPAPSALTTSPSSENPLVAAPQPSVGHPPRHPHNPAIIIRQRDDETTEVEIGRGIEIKTTEDGYLVRSVEPKKAGAAAKIMNYLEHHYGELVKGGLQFVGGLARGIFLFFLTLMLAAYLMITHETIIGFFRGLVKADARDDFDNLLARLDKGLSGVVRGQLLICLVNGVLTAIGFAMLGVKYWPVLSLIAAFGSLIPIFGTILSSFPAVAVGLTQSFSMALLVLGWIILIHQIEANFLNPKIIGTAAHLHPVLVVFVLLAGEHLFHAPGALLACPVLSIAQSLFLHFREVADREPVSP